MAARPKHCRATTTGVCNVRRRLSFPMARCCYSPGRPDRDTPALEPSCDFGLNPPLGANNTTQKDIIRLLNAEGIAVDYTEDINAFTNLNQYASIIFFDGSREAMWNHGNYVVPSMATSTSNDRAARFSQNHLAAIICARAVVLLPFITRLVRNITGRGTRACWAMATTITTAETATGPSMIAVADPSTAWHRR